MRGLEPKMITSFLARHLKRGLSQAIVHYYASSVRKLARLVRGRVSFLVLTFIAKHFSERIVLEYMPYILVS
eukprot:scaffold267619_cov19-Prasinocladus_malaysianus.AAC.1